jgi:hypothetical protein
VTRGWRAAALAVTLAACGLKNDPIAPELVRPTPPAKLTAKSVKDGVELQWRRPTEYTGGKRMRDLGGFDIERASASGAPFTKVGTLTLSDQQRFRQQRDMSWTDSAAQPDAEYLYRVVAFTADGSRSDPSAVVQVRYTPPPPAPAKPAGPAK